MSNPTSSRSVLMYSIGGHVLSVATETAGSSSNRARSSVVHSSADCACTGRGALTAHSIAEMIAPTIDIERFDDGVLLMTAGSYHESGGESYGGDAIVHAPY